MKFTKKVLGIIDSVAGDTRVSRGGNGPHVSDLTAEIRRLQKKVRDQQTASRNLRGGRA